MKKKISFDGWLQKALLRMTRLHYILAILFAAQIILYDALKLLTPEAVLRRWIAVGIWAAIVTAVWYFSHSGNKQTNYFKQLVFVLIMADIALASFFVYSGRGMAARAVFLYVIPLLVSAALLSRSAVMATAAFCVIAYSATAISYFVLNFNEGYKIELYGEVGFYCAFILACGAFLGVLIRSKE